MRLAAVADGVEFTGEIHPEADRYPMLSPEELEALADSIATDGLDKPIDLDAFGVLVDGRNRLAACDLADVEPDFIVHPELDTHAKVARFVRRANTNRRNMNTGQKAMDIAIGLAADGKRINGKWSYGSVNVQMSGRSDDRSGWQEAMRLAGHVIDYCAYLGDGIVLGTITLNEAAEEAAKIRADLAANAAAAAESERQRLSAEQIAAEQLADLRSNRADLAELVDSGNLALDVALSIRWQETADERKRVQMEEERIAKFSRDVVFAIQCLAEITCSDRRREQVGTLRLDEMPATPITANAIASAIESLELIHATHKENL